jgi:autotransporter adhesin
VDNSITTAVSNVNIGFAGNSGGTVTRSSGQVLTIQGDGTTAGSYSGGNIRTETDPTTGAVNIQIADSPTFGNVTVNADGTGKITGVTDATLSSTSTEAVNGSQLVALGDSIASSLSPGSTYDPTTNAINTQIVVGGNVYNNVESAIQAVNTSAAVGWNVTTASTGSGVSTGSSVSNVAPGSTATFTAGNNMMIHQNGSEVQVALNPNLTGIESIAISGGPTINGDGIDMGGDRITNLGAGIALTDAVNVGQLNAGLSNTLNQANTYTDNAISNVRFDLSQYRRDANGGTASAMAMGTVPQAFEPGMGIMGFGVAHWQGEQAFAVGFSKASDDGRVVIRASGTYNTRRQAGAAAGVGVQF